MHTIVAKIAGTGPGGFPLREETFDEEDEAKNNHQSIAYGDESVRRSRGVGNDVFRDRAAYHVTSMCSKSFVASSMPSNHAFPILLRWIPLRFVHPNSPRALAAYVGSRGGGDGGGDGGDVQVYVFAVNSAEPVHPRTLGQER